MELNFSNMNNCKNLLRPLGFILCVGEFLYATKDLYNYCEPPANPQVTSLNNDGTVNIQIKGIDLPEKIFLQYNQISYWGQFVCCFYYGSCCQSRCYWKSWWKWIR